MASSASNTRVERREDDRRNLALKFAIIRDGRRAWEIASDAGISPGELSAIVTGRSWPRQSTRRNLSDVLGLPESELFDWRGS